MKKQRVTLYLDQDVWRELRAIALRMETSASALVESGIRESIQRGDFGPFTTEVRFQEYRTRLEQELQQRGDERGEIEK